jgi:hypothetical protein
MVAATDLEVNTRYSGHYRKDEVSTFCRLIRI